MEKWNFPSNGNGQIRGYSDAGIETFSGNEIQSLAREMCQNSLDAQADEKTTVRVEFESEFIDSSNIPGYQDYRKIISLCKTYWDDKNTEKAHKFFKSAIKKITEEKTFVLRISDYNTKGLSNPYSDSFEGWNSLTKVDGGSTKDGDSAGSFGVGKNAPFSNSYYRLVFYRTLNEKKEIAAQGMSRLLSFPKNVSEPMDTMTVGIGYYGNSNKNMPVQRISEIDKINKRTEVGTDVFVYGFKSSSGWEDEMTVEILESFLMSIYHRKLEVKIQNKTLNSSTLSAMIIRYSKKAKNAYCNYRVLSESDKVQTFEMDFHGMGTLKLKVLIDTQENLNRKVLVVRKSGMRLFQMAGISRAISFSGILELEGVRLNEYFREMETMAHDKWEPKRHSNPKQAKEYYDELKDLVRTTVMDLGENTEDEEIEVEGLGGVLQGHDSVRENEDSDNKNENLNNHLGEIKIIERPKALSKGKFYPLGDDDSNEGKTNKVPGTVNPKGKTTAIRTLKGQRKRTKRDTHRGNPDPSGKDIINKKNGVSTPCELNYVRIMQLEKAQYRLIFEVPNDVEEGHIEVVTVGENGKSNKLIISDVLVRGGCEKAGIYLGVIKFKNIKRNTRVKLDYTFVELRKFAMEVNVYEDN